VSCKTPHCTAHYESNLLNMHSKLFRIFLVIGPGSERRRARLTVSDGLSLSPSPHRPFDDDDRDAEDDEDDDRSCQQN